MAILSDVFRGSARVLSCVARAELYREKEKEDPGLKRTASGEIDEVYTPRESKKQKTDSKAEKKAKKEKQAKEPETSEQAEKPKEFVGSRKFTGARKGKQLLSMILNRTSFN